MSFWGELSDLKPPAESPRSILQAAANEIADKTNRRIRGEIDSTSGRDGQLLLRFFLGVPSVGYSVELLRITYKPTALYPVVLEDTFELDRRTEYQTPEQFKAALTKLFGDTRIRTVVANLLEQAAEEPGEDEDT